jgi:outer membrane protein assembly factor BamB
MKACSSEQAANGSTRHGLKLTFVAMAALLVAVTLVMSWGKWSRDPDESWIATELDAARRQLVIDPTSEALKARIRVLDAEVRAVHFRGLERNRRGAWLLLIAAVGLVLAAKGLASIGVLQGAVPGALRTAPVVPERRREPMAVIFTGVAVLVSLATVGVMFPDRLSEAAVATENTTAGGTDLGRAADEQAQPVGEGDWPRFLGPMGASRSTCTNLPLTWDVASGEHVAWKVEVPLQGFSSPVVMKDHVFVTGGDEQQRLIYCFAVDTGEVLWQRAATPTNASPGKVMVPDLSGAAASTIATDGERVFAIFATGELAALNLTGELVWSQRLDLRENSFGHAASLVTWRNQLLVQADQAEPADNKSQLLAYDTRTGGLLWKVPRPVGSSWTTPLIVDGSGGPQLVTAGDPWLISYDPNSGRERWRADVLGAELAPSLVFGAGWVIASLPNQHIAALRPDGIGDVTQSAIVWKSEEDIPDVPTPVAFGDLLWTADSAGRVVCRETATGNRIWDHTFETEFQASPLMAGDRLYLFGQPGDVFVIGAARQFQLLATNAMDDMVYASPAVSDGRLIVRTSQYLYCLSGVSAPTHHARVP